MAHKPPQAPAQLHPQSLPIESPKKDPHDQILDPTQNHLPRHRGSNPLSPADRIGAGGPCSAGCGSGPHPSHHGRSQPMWAGKPLRPREKEEKEKCRQWQPLRAIQPLRTQKVTLRAAEQRLGAAQTAVDVPLAYAQRGGHLATAALAGAATFTEMVHYPRRDVVDAKAGTRFYYHAHRHDGAEHGHFHLFHAGPGQAGFSHLAALSLNTHGWPTKWFTTNEWVTGETWLPAHQMAPLLQHFSIRCMGRLAPVARWLTAMVHLYGPELQQLLVQRDRQLDQLMRTEPHPSAAHLRQDRRIEVLSEVLVDLPQTIAHLQTPATPGA